MFRHCHGHPFDFAHAPILLTGVATSFGVSMVDTELFQVPDLGSRVLPLLPDKAAKSPDDPSFQCFEDVPGFDQAVVVPPSSDV